MMIAVPYEDGNIFQHFGHTERFKIYDVVGGEVVVTAIINTNGSGHGALADILKKCNVDTLICGGIGGGAKRALSEAGIALYGGATGGADKAVEDLIANRLAYDPDVECSHHGEGHEGHHGGECGSHGGTCKGH